MCLLTYLAPNAEPDIEALYNGTITNNDGHGYAIVIPSLTTSKLIVRKSLNANELLEKFARDRQKYPDGPALFHSRFGTGGSNNKYNCHPFYLGKDRSTVVAHNGVLPSNMQPKKHDNRCDTRKAAQEIFPYHYGDLASEQARLALGEAIGKGNKLVILTISEQFDSWAYIVNEEQGIWEGDIWYSNSSYKPYVAPKANGKGWKTRFEDCKECGGIASVDMDYRLCDYCDSCYDCQKHWEKCRCMDSYRYFMEPIEHAS